MTDTPPFKDFFDEGSLWKLLRGENPYTFLNTYSILQQLFGYELPYANYGYWEQGLDTPEPGQKLTIHLGEALGISPGDRVLEAGSGLGQCAVDLCGHFEAEQVLGMNVCAPQVRYANALAAAAGLSDKIEHQEVDACAKVQSLEPGAFNHALAQECIGHFPDPLGFLTGVRKMLPSGGRMAFTLVTSPKPPPRPQAIAQKTFFGVVPHDGAHWAGLMEQAGFTDVRREDMTEVVFVPMFGFIRRKLREEPESFKVTGPAGRLALRAFLKVTEAGVRRGTMGYELLVGQAP